MEVATLFELVPTDGRVSFYRKAMVRVDNDGSKTLYSYGTKIMTVFSDGSAVRYWDGYTMTTGRHIRSFCGLNKKEYMALELKENQY